MPLFCLMNPKNFGFSFVTTISSFSLEYDQILPQTSISEVLLKTVHQHLSILCSVGASTETIMDTMSNFVLR